MAKGTVKYIDHSSAQKTVEVKHAPMSFPPFPLIKDYTDQLERICEKLDRICEKDLKVDVKNEINPQIDVKPGVPDIHVNPCETEINYKLLFIIALVPTLALVCDILIRTFH